jgi:hypothetical protein
MKYHKLRIAWSVTCGVACVVLVALWVRSYYWMDIMHQYKRLTSAKGNVYLNQVLNCPEGIYDEWSYPSGYWTMRFRGQSVVPTGPRGLSAPYWLLVTTAVLTGGVSWLPIRRFSLSTLLIAITLVACLLGAIVCATR